MIRDLAQLKQAVEQKIKHSISYKIWGWLEYRFSPNLDIQSSIKNYQFLDKTTQKLVQAFLIMQFLADEPLNLGDVNQNAELLNLAYTEAMRIKITSVFGTEYEKLLQNWGENQKLIYKDIDISKCLNMRIAQSVAPEINARIQDEIRYNFQ